MLGPVIALDSHGFRTEASEFQRLFQSIPYALSAGGQTPIKNPESKRAELKLYCWQAIVAGYTRRQLPHEQEFAMDTCFYAKHGLLKQRCSV
jgi:hypothetical protein